MSATYQICRLLLGLPVFACGLSKRAEIRELRTAGIKLHALGRFLGRRAHL
jgi:hypothetical protein